MIYQGKSNILEWTNRTKHLQAGRRMNRVTAGNNTGFAAAGTVAASERAFSKCEFATDAT